MTYFDINFCGKTGEILTQDSEKCDSPMNYECYQCREPMRDFDGTSWIYCDYHYFVESEEK